jgi:hypothetical protein
VKYVTLQEHVWKICDLREYIPVSLTLFAMLFEVYEHLLLLLIYDNGSHKYFFHPEFYYVTTGMYEGVSKSFQTGRLERELQMVQLSATRRSCIAILWICLLSFSAIPLCVASQRVFIVVSVYFVIDSVRKLLDTLSYVAFWNKHGERSIVLTCCQ